MKKKNIYTVFSLILVLAMAFCLAGCGNRQVQPDTEPESVIEKDVTAESEETDNEVTSSEEETEEETMLELETENTTVEQTETEEQTEEETTTRKSARTESKKETTTEYGSRTKQDITSERKIELESSVRENNTEPGTMKSAERETDTATKRMTAFPYTPKEASTVREAEAETTVLFPTEPASKQAPTEPETESETTPKAKTASYFGSSRSTASRNVNVVSNQAADTSPETTTAEQSMQAFEEITVPADEYAPEYDYGAQPGTTEYSALIVECPGSPNGYHSWTDIYDWYNGDQLINTGTEPIGGFTNSLYLYSVCDYCGEVR